MAGSSLRLAALNGAVVDPPVDEPRTFEEFFATESNDLFSRLWLVTRDRQEAEEVMQDAFLVVLERWERVAAMENPTGYLYRVAFNGWRKRSRRAARALHLTLDPGPMPDDFQVVDDRTVIGEALADLTPRQRAALVLIDLMGYGSEEAGQMMGVRAVTVRVLASQARASMREGIGDARG